MSKAYLRACHDIASCYHRHVTSYPLPNAAATQELGAKIGRVLKAGDCVALRGDLGAGKTSLVRGLVQAALGDVDVPSPTYTLVQIYDLPDYELWHCDLYRLETPNDAYELGLIDAMLDAVCIIEWPDKLGDLLPKNALELRLEFAGEGRVAILEGWNLDDLNLEGLNLGGGDV